MSRVRLRRLAADYQNLYEYVHTNPRLELVQAMGNPPEKYQLCYQVNSLRKEEDSDPVAATQHMVEIVLPRDYPRTPPLCRMLTPVFHPNIAPHAICIGDHWNAGEPLWSMVSRIGEMLAYQSFNVKSPLNGEAARWVEKNMEKVPLDTACMVPDNPPGTLDTAPRVASAPIEAKVIPAAGPLPSPPQTTAPVAPPKAKLPQVPPSASVVPSQNPPAQRPPAQRPPAQRPPAQRPPLQNPPTQKPVVQPDVQPEMFTIACPGCKTKFRIKRENQGKQFRCPKCTTVFK